MHALHIWKCIAHKQIQYSTKLKFCRQNPTFANKNMMTHSQANHKSCFCKQIQPYGSRVSHVYTDIGMSMHPHTPNNYKHTRTQPQLFCYFPLQHLVLISFLMRLRLRPIRADYQRRSGVGCMPTMTPVPRERPGWKRPQQYAHTYACRSTHRHTSLQFFPKQKYEPHIGFCEYYCTL